MKPSKLNEDILEMSDDAIWKNERIRQSMNLDVTGLKTGDVITDFTSGDKFEFLNSEFGFTATGTLASGSFSSLSVAFDGTNSGISGSDAYFVFDQTTETLYHDLDQTVDGYSVIATVQAGASLTNADITLNS